MVSDTDEFEKYLAEEEYENTTIRKYIRDAVKFQQFMKSRNLPTVSKDEIILYKKYLIAVYSPQSVNSMLASLNSYLKYLHHPELAVKYIKIQQKPFADSDKYLSRGEYILLVNTAYKTGEYSTGVIMETLCSTGIRIDELKYVTVEGILKQRIKIYNKGKAREILIPQHMQEKLLSYIAYKSIGGGYVFRTKSGKPLDRSNIWKKMKKIASAAGISEKRVYPHNLRHVFAETYYENTNDLISLANLLGHTSIDTTRIYLKRMEQDFKGELEKMNLVTDNSLQDSDLKS